MLPLAPSLIAAITAIFLFWLKVRSDQFSSRIEAFCDLVDDAGILAIDYWLNGSLAGLGHDRDLASSVALQKQEVRLRAFQIRLQGEFERVATPFDEQVLLDARSAFADLINALTGEPFGDRSSAQEVTIAQDAANAAARLTRILKEGRDEASGFRHLVLTRSKRLARMCFARFNHWRALAGAEIAKCRWPGPVN